MKAIVVSKPGDPTVLKLSEVEKPKPGPAEVLIRVEAVGVNRADTLLRGGRVPGFVEKHPILGAEVSGIVEAVGAEVKRWTPGDRVAALTPVGGYAEYLALRQELVFSLPENLSLIEMAAIPEVFITAYQLLFWIGKLSEGQMVLVHAGASGVGTAAIQLAKAAGAKVISTSRDSRKTDFCTQLGSDLGITVAGDRFSTRVVDSIRESAFQERRDQAGYPFHLSIRARSRRSSGDGVQC